VTQENHFDPDNHPFFNPWEAKAWYDLKGRFQDTAGSSQDGGTKLCASEWVVMTGLFPGWWLL